MATPEESLESAAFMLATGTTSAAIRTTAASNPTRDSARRFRFASRIAISRPSSLDVLAIAMQL